LAASFISNQARLLEVPQELIRTALDLELQDGTVVADRVGETPAEAKMKRRLERIDESIQARGTAPRRYGRPHEWPCRCPCGNPQWS
jgi:hypothetical protein